MDKIELIDRIALLDKFCEAGLGVHSLVERVFADGVYAVIESAPTIDAAPVDVAVTLRRALAHMWYAYVNKDSECPHEFELEAVREAEALLGKWEDCMPIMMRREERHEPED